ncbi:hypothetical protein BDB01DRAFT_796604 [Pilobolus umbonatus]|nr:hypothetical protein BDB01DRAFT_796604 [Pilobolus umbonatus]
MGKEKFLIINPLYQTLNNTIFNMRFTGLIAAASIFASTLAQSTSSDSLNLTAMVGTWHTAGVSKCFFQTAQILTELYNVTLSCPQTTVGIDNNNNITFTPSIVLGWWDQSRNRKSNTTLSASGYLNLIESTNNTGTFNLTATLPNALSMGSINGALTMLASGNGSGFGGSGQMNVSSILQVQLASTSNNGTNDIAIFNATQSQLITQGKNRTMVTDFDLSDFVSAIFINGANALNETMFNTTLRNYNMSSYVRLNDTCPQ